MALKLNQSRHGLFWRFVVPVAGVFALGIIAIAVCVIWLVEEAPAYQLVAGLGVCLAIAVGGLFGLYRHSIARPLESLSETLGQLETGSSMSAAGDDVIAQAQPNTSRDLPAKPATLPLVW